MNASTAQHENMPPVIILAGGKGTRIRDIHPDIPKPLIPVAGKPFLVWQIEWLKNNGVTDVILSIGYRAEKIIDYFTQNPIDDITLQFIAEKEPLGTGGAVKFAAKNMHTEHCIICNGDSLCPTQLAPLYEKALDTKDADAIILATRVDDASDYGTITCDDAGHIHGFTEKGDIKGTALVNAGVYCVRTQWVHALPETVPLSIENHVFPQMQPTKLHVCTTDTPFIDIGVPDRLAYAEKALNNMLRRQR